MNASHFSHCDQRMTESANTSFLRTAKVLWLVLIGVLVYLVTAVLLVPAGWLWHWLSPRIELPPQLTVHQVSGTIWNGATGLSFQGRPLIVHWQLNWPSLTTLALPVGFTIESLGSQVHGRLIAGWPDRANLEARGRIHVKDFASLIEKSGGAMLDGDVSIEQLSLSWQDGRFQTADGLATWPGGSVVWPQGGRSQSAQFPAMKASVSGQSGRLSLQVARQGSDQPVADADILPDGMLEVRVYKRLLDLAGQSWSGAASPGDVIFKVRQPLLPGGRR